MHFEQICKTAKDGQILNENTLYNVGSESNLMIIKFHAKFDSKVRSLKCSNGIRILITLYFTIKYASLMHNTFKSKSAGPILIRIDHFAPTYLEKKMRKLSNDQLK
uniref:Uncharacterized protein n=1 Tax=Onchocerca volvulus TaxID=6282 RepID=A0A8R1XKJ3_ONCVO